MKQNQKKHCYFKRSQKSYRILYGWIQTMIKPQRWIVAIILTFFHINAATAGYLILKNTSDTTINCKVDGWTTSSGNNHDKNFEILPNQLVYVSPNPSQTNPIINWIQCGSYIQTRAMSITSEGPDQTLILNGKQNRVLNVALYPYLPTMPDGDFTKLVKHVVETYQKQNPKVLLNAVLNENVNIYSFTNLPTLLSANGFDVIELDVLYLGFLAQQGLINPVLDKDKPKNALPVALKASTYKNDLWGIPSWLCMDFLFSTDKDITNNTSLKDLLTFLKKDSAPSLIGNYNGSWRLPGMYISSYVQTYGYDNVDNAMVMPPDKTVINNLISLTNTCANTKEVNKCTNNTYHDASNGTTEKVFALSEVSNDMGFSEQSFYINLYGYSQALYVTPTPWGDTPQPLLYSDSFVTSSKMCPNGSICADDAMAFISLMTSLDMKNYIVQSQDLSEGSPWRTLLVANDDFWQQSQIKDNPLYKQYKQVLTSAQPFPNDFTDKSQTDMESQICKKLKAKQPSYVCD